MGNPTVRLAVPAPGTGAYEYLLDDSPSGVTEAFSVTSGGPAAPWVLESERRAPGGVLLRVEGSGSDALNGTIEATFESEDTTPRTALYLIDGGRLSVRSQGVEGPVSTRGDAVLSPLMRVFQGPAIGALLGAGGDGEVVMPALDPTDEATLLLATVEIREARTLATEADGSRRCSYIGGNYDATAEFWIDRTDRLVRYLFDQGDRSWDVRLVDG